MSKGKSKERQEIVMPVGKHRGKTVAAVFAEEPSYLCWFHETVDGFEDVKQAISALPEFAVSLAKHRERKQIRDKSLEQRIEEVVTRMFAVDPTPAEMDMLCDRLFHSQPGS